MDLSVIIVNYNVRQFLENALTSIGRALEGLTGEIIVVDNASDDGSAAMVRAKFPAVRLIESAENLGFARANNLALREARGRHLLLINPDTIVQEDTCRVMVDFLDAHPEVGLAGCKILNPDGSFQLPCRRSFPTPWVAFTKTVGLSSLFPRSRMFGRYNLTYLDPDASYEVDAVSGSFMMLRREVYEKIGGLDEAFFMYGEDLDWCYRVKQAGWSVSYVHTTRIIHFKGESTRRSNLDEVRVFYGAMVLFVQKHFSHSRIGLLFLRLGIFLRGGVAWLRRALQPLLSGSLDFILVAIAMIAAEWLYFGRIFSYPAYAYPIVWTVPGLMVVVVGAASRLYSTHRLAAFRAAMTVFVSYFVISAMVFFIKTFAFSRAVVLISGMLSMVLLPGWRIVARAWGKRSADRGREKTLFGSRTLIVGCGPSGQEVLRKLRARVDDGYDVLGFIDATSARIGESVAGVEIVGSVENVGKVIDERQITDVIFATDELSYAGILGVIGRSTRRDVNFRLVPTSLEAIIGKTRIDDLDPLPLVEIEYNIHRPANRMGKRLFDVTVAALLLIVLTPLRVLGRVRREGPFATFLTGLSEVVAGRKSFVGVESGGVDPRNSGGPYLGPRGLTGLVQVNRRANLPVEERERYELYYAKNQSFVLDMEIMLKAMLQLLRRQGDHSWQK
ncbi:MAG: glycosyltransferase [Ignavibacteriae bacterium]|nr:glycosyltransferase [Ignavibacteriota bacterium]